MNFLNSLSTNKIILLAHTGKRFPIHWTYPIGASFFALLTPYLSSLCILPFYIFAAWRNPGFINRISTELTFDGLLAFLGIFIFVAGWLWIFERRNLASTGLTREYFLYKYIRGLVVGMLMVGTTIAIINATDKFVLSNQLTINSTTLLRGTVIMFIGFAIQGAAEEVLARGFVFPIVGARFGVVWGLLLSSGLFSLLHILNPNLQITAIANLFLFGVFAALFTLWDSSLWGICGLHTAWNWTLGSIFGAPVSGLHVKPSLLMYSPGNSSLWNGGGFGPEGGFAVSLVLIAGITVLLWRLVHNNRIKYHESYNINLR